MKVKSLKPVYLILLLILIVLSSYYPTLFAPLNSLDDVVFVNHLLNQNEFTWSRHFLPAGSPEYYRPLLTLSFEIDRIVGGLHQQFMHFFNILIHAANTLLIFMVARSFGRFGGRSGPLLPFLCAAVFALHPLNTEAVNWIAGRTDLLAGFFAFSSLFFFLLALSSRKLIFGVIAMLLLLGGALCKETALFLAPGLILTLVWRPGNHVAAWPGRKYLVVWVGATLSGYVFLRHWGLRYDRGVDQAVGVLSDVVMRNHGEGMANVVDSAVKASPSLFDALQVLCKAIGFYAVKLVQPLPLNFAIHKVPDYYVAPGLLVVALLLFALLKRTPAGVFLLLSAGIASSALLAVFTGVTWTPIAERYMYIPSGPFIIAAMFACADLFDHFQLQSKVKIAVIVGLLLMAAVTVKRNFVWQDNLSLYRDTVEKSPDFVPAKTELARALYAQGEPDEADAITLSIKGDAGQVSSLNRAAALARQEKYEEARNFLREEISKHNSLERHALDMMIRITSIMAEKSDDETLRRMYLNETVTLLNRLMELSSDAFNWYRLGRVHLWLGNRKQAQSCFAEAVRLLPEDSLYLKPAKKLAEELSR